MVRKNWSYYLIIPDVAVLVSLVYMHCFRGSFYVFRYHFPQFHYNTQLVCPPLFFFLLICLQIITYLLNTLLIFLVLWICHNYVHILISFTYNILAFNQSEPGSEPELMILTHQTKYLPNIAKYLAFPMPFEPTSKGKQITCIHVW
jgi:hypothetical protein